MTGDLARLIHQSQNHYRQEGVPDFTLGHKHMQLISSYQGANSNPGWVKFLEVGHVLSTKY